MNDQTFLRVQVAWACRMLARAGHGDWTLGHVSVRAPDGLFYMKRSGVGLDEVTPDDVLTIDSTGARIAGRGAVHGEYPIHTEIYRKRPDIGAVIHTHPPYSTALGCTNSRLEFLGHDSIMFCDGLTTFRETAELIARPEQGRAVAVALGAHRAALLGNHGVVVVGKDIPWATVGALTLERAARIQSIASTLGPLSPMPPEMAERLYPTKYNDGLVYQYWSYLIREVRRDGLDWGMPAETLTGELNHAEDV